MSTNTKAVQLDQSQLREIRRALIIGLACFGDVEERINASELAAAGGAPWPEQANPTHPTGSSDVPSLFATALAYVE